MYDIDFNFRMLQAVKEVRLVFGRLTRPPDLSSFARFRGLLILRFLVKPESGEHNLARVSLAGTCLGWVGC
jgi:hypothetical protein